MMRSKISKLLPAGLKRRLRPLVMPLLYRLEQGRLRALYAALVRSGDLVFDIGAAEGYVSQVLLELGARVVAVEPQPSCLEVLRSRLAHQPRLQVEPVGVAERAGSRDFFVADGDPEISTFDLEKWRSGRYRDRQWNRRLRLPVTTLDELIAKHGVPLFCKIDVEGYEERVLSGLSQCLPQLSFEFSREFLGDVTACARLLERLGSCRFNVSLYRRHALAGPWLEDPEELVAALAAHPDPQLVGDVYVRSVTPRGP
jgi:FkbM family methyltransferase